MNNNDKPVLMMDQKLFEELLAQGRISEILMQGGINLTPNQLKAVKEQSKQEAADEVERRKMAVAAKPGYREFMMMPLMSKIMSSIGDTLPGQNPAVNPVKEQRVVKEQPKQKTQKKDNKDPEFASIGPKGVQNLKINDTEADVVVKIFNFLQRKQEFEKKKNDESEKLRKENALIKDQRTEDIVAALLGEKPKSISGVKKNPKAKALTEEGKKKTSSFMKYGALGALGIGGVLAAQKAFASIPKFEIPNVDDILKRKPKETPKETEEKPDITQAPKVSGDWMNDKEFVQNVQNYAKEMNLNFSDLIAVMAAESKLDPTAVNPSSGASGLIQFMPSTAKELGTSVEDIRKMSRTEQFDLAKKYFDKQGLQKGATGADIYAKVFLPARSGKEVLTQKGEKYYEANVGLDIGKKGYISKSDLASIVEQKKKSFNIPESVPTTPGTAVAAKPVTKASTYIDQMNSTWQETLDILDKLETAIKNTRITQITSNATKATTIAVQVPTVNDTPALITNQYGK